MTRKALPLFQTENVLRQYTQEEAAALVEQWLVAFGAKKNGVNTKAYLWHIFSGSRYPSVSGKEAILEYENQVAPEYIVLSNDRKTVFSTNSIPKSSSPIFDDYYVFPTNLAWTMAFTHEDGWLVYTLHVMLTFLY